MSSQLPEPDFLLAGAALGDLSVEELAAWESLSEAGQEKEFSSDQELAELNELVGILETQYTQEIEHPPAHLQEQILADIEPFVRDSSQVNPTKEIRQEKPKLISHPSASYSSASTSTSSGSAISRWWHRPELGWAVAACLAVAWYGSLRFMESSTDQESSSAGIDVAIQTAEQIAEEKKKRFDQLQAEADALAANFQSAEGYEGVTGQVLWHPKTQQGFLLLAGLPKNNPKESQYQLWIADPSRDEAPIDGGVFDFVSTGDSNSLLIPIDAKLQVDNPVAFVITEEQAGGVVVSKQDRVVALASPEV